MKKIIRFLADISGVTDDITTEANRQAGHAMFWNAYWWNGGIMHKEEKWDLYNAFMLYADWLKRGFHAPIGSGMMDLRTKVYDSKGEKLPPNPPTPPQDRVFTPFGKVVPPPNHSDGNA
jgi:hypothetical protein